MQEALSQDQKNVGLLWIPDLRGRGCLDNH